MPFILLAKLHHGALLLSRQCSLLGAAELTLVPFFSGDLWGSACVEVTALCMVDASLLWGGWVGGAGLHHQFGSASWGSTTKGAFHHKGETHQYTRTSGSSYSYYYCYYYYDYSSYYCY